MSAIYFDLDGVLADWVDQFEKCSPIPLSQFNELDKSLRSDIKKVLFDYNFFRNMKPIDKGVQYFNDVREIYPNIAVLSAVGDHNKEAVKRAKREWVAEVLGPDVEVILVDKGEDKWDAIEPEQYNVLIDDRQKFLDAWAEKGGKRALGILFEKVEA